MNLLKPFWLNNTIAWCVISGHGVSITGKWFCFVVLMCNRLAAQRRSVIFTLSYMLVLSFLIGIAHWGNLSLMFFPDQHLFLKWKQIEANSLNTGYHQTIHINTTFLVDLPIAPLQTHTRNIAWPGPLQETSWQHKDRKEKCPNCFLQFSPTRSFMFRSTPVSYLLA